MDLRRKEFAVISGGVVKKNLNNTARIKKLEKIKKKTALFVEKMRGLKKTKCEKDRKSRSMLRKKNEHCNKLKNGYKIVWKFILANRNRDIVIKKYFKLLICFAALFFVAFEYQGIHGEAAEVVWDKTMDVSVKKGNFVYHAYLSADKQYSWIYQVEQVIKKDCKVLRFPKVMKGAVVVKLGGVSKPKDEFYRDIWGELVEPYHHLDHYKDMPKGIESLQIPDTITQITAGTFCGFHDLKSVKLPDGIKKLSYGIFYNCRSLEEVQLPKKLKEINLQAFDKCRSLKKFTISSQSTRYSTKDGMLLSRDGKTFYLAPIGKKYVKIPQGVETIASAAFMFARAKKVWIPESVVSIQDAAFYGRKIKNIILMGNNSHYGKSGDCIYSKKSGRLVVAICKNGTLSLPKQVKYLSENVSYAGKRVKTLILPKTLKKLKKNCFAQIRKEQSWNLYFLSTTPPKVVKDSFDAVIYSYDVTYYVPKGSIEAYKKWYDSLLDGEEDIELNLQEY